MSVTYFVDKHSHGCTSDGSNWKNAFKQLSDAFNVISSISELTDVTIYIKEGKYHGNYALNNNKVNLTIIGGQDKSLKGVKVNKKTNNRTKLVGGKDVEQQVLQLLNLPSVQLKNLTITKGFGGLQIIGTNGDVVKLNNTHVCNNKITAIVEKRGGGADIRNYDKLFIKNSVFNNNQLISEDNVAGGGLYILSVNNICLYKVSTNKNILRGKRIIGGGISITTVGNVTMNKINVKCNKAYATNVNNIEQPAAGAGIRLYSANKANICNTLIENNYLEGPNALYSGLSTQLIIDLKLSNITLKNNKLKSDVFKNTCQNGGYKNETVVTCNVKVL